MSFKLFNSPNLKTFIKIKEGYNFERKPARIDSRKLAAEFSAFANSSIEGGLVVVGIENDVDIVGINSVGEAKINKLLQTQKDFCPLANIKHKFFNIKNSKKENDRLLLFFVEYATDKVIELTSGEAYEEGLDAFISDYVESKI